MPNGIQNCDWMKGRQWSPAERRKRAHGFALSRGLSAPIWIDEKEAELMRLRAKGTPYREIATLLGVTKTAAKTRYRYIRLGRRNKRMAGTEKSYVRIENGDVHIASHAPPMLALPAPPKLLALPPPDWMRAVPAKLPWHTPDIWETGRIKVAPPGRTHVLYLDDGEDGIIIRRPTACRGVMIGEQWFKFDPPVLLSAAHYYVEINCMGMVEMGEVNGEFDDVAWARSEDIQRVAS